MSSTLDAVIGPTRIISVVTLADVAHAEPVARALATGGLPAVEFTLRTSAGLAAISAAAAVDDAIVGAGSVVSAGQARAAIDAGARFLVSPGLVPDVLSVAAESGVPAVPGVVTATELIQARAAGVDVVKFFPAAASGGLAAVAALASVFPDVSFVPTGGIDAASAADYLRHPAVRAVGGSWTVPATALAASDWDTVRTLAAQAAALAVGIDGSGRTP